jgi:predicted ribosomally synthesized peptide with SipW-like signal peptide
MKKIGLLALALIMALGALGIGYAAWTDTINITGTVHTGSLNIDVTGYSGTWVYKVPGDTAHHEIWIYRGNAAIPFSPPAGSFEVAHAVALPDGEDAIKVEFVNLFPDIDFIADATLTYTGTVPAKINKITWDFGDQAWIGQGIRDGWIYATARDAQGQVVLEGFQMHQGATVYLELHITVPEVAALMSQSGSFSAIIEIVQWNEYPYIAPNS